MAVVPQHRFVEPPLWQRFSGHSNCVTCNLPREDPVHIRALKPLLMELRNTGRSLVLGPRTEITAEQVRQAIVNLAQSNGTTVEWPRLLSDRRYLTASYAEFVHALRDHWQPVFRSAEEFSDCEDHMEFFAAWGTLVKITAIANVHDYSVRVRDSQGLLSSHAYNLVVLEDRVILFDPGTSSVVNPGQQPKWSFKDVRIEV